MNILIVTYTYPPAKSVNGFRPYHFARALTSAGWKVSVLTRHFTGNEQVPEDYVLSNRDSGEVEIKLVGNDFSTTPAPNVADPKKHKRLVSKLKISPVFFREPHCME